MISTTAVWKIDALAFAEGENRFWPPRCSTCLRDSGWANRRSGNKENGNDHPW